MNATVAGRACRLPRGVAEAIADRRGGVTVEFAFLALPFVLLVLFVIDVSAMFVADTVLDRALQTVARKIRTGEAQTGSMTQSEFKTAVCEEMLSLFDCAAKVYISVTVVSDIASVTYADPVDSEGKLKTSASFDMGTGGDYVLAQAYLEWTSYAALLSGYTAALSNGDILLSAATLFRNEPYDD